MDNMCNYGGAPNVGIQQEDEVTLCPATVHEEVCVQAQVTITPVVTPGDVKTFCIGSPRIGVCRGILRRNCVFYVSQGICVEVPLSFSATAESVPKGIVCGIPQTGECSESEDALV